VVIQALNTLLQIFEQIGMYLCCKFKLKHITYFRTEVAV
jgi:LytS/YehU family sensor histidine kinase